MLPHIEYRQGLLTIDGVSAEALAGLYGTPVYVYAANAIRDRYRTLEQVFGPLSPTICYAVKACSNLHVCRLLAGLGAGMDVVSGGELERAWLSGVPMSNLVFAGTGKTEPEIRAALDGSFSPLRVAGGEATLPDPASRGPIGRFNVESEQELDRIARIAASLGVVAPCSLRVNPNVDAHTHKFTTTGKHENKFGVPIARAEAILARFRDHPNLRLRGLHCHLGSPIATPGPYVEGLEVLAGLIERLASQGGVIESLNIGGGFGVEYGNNAVEPIESFAAAINPILEPWVTKGLKVLIEPGRWIVANAGVLLTRVQYIKKAGGGGGGGESGGGRAFAICDAGVHTLIRPALYGAHHTIWPAQVSDDQTLTSLTPPVNESMCRYDVVGPICESSDFLAQQRPMPEMRAGELLAVFSAGAYGMSMASTYNDHPKPAEVLADRGAHRLVRRRQTARSLIEDELGLAE